MITALLFPRPFDLGVQKYLGKQAIDNGDLILFVMSGFVLLRLHVPCFSSQPVSKLCLGKKNSRLGVFFEEKGKVGAVVAGALGLVLIKKLA
jgi:hypothetical protein